MKKCLILAFALAAYNVTQAREIKGLIAVENDTTALPGVLSQISSRLSFRETTCK